jgi:nicotinamide-nucleotide amidase
MIPVSDPTTRVAQEVGRALLASGRLLVVAESCTGGGIAEAVTRIPGSSAWFDLGFITYSYAAKESVLGVPQALIQARGAVHVDVASAMADGALARSPLATVAVAVTGIAGPDGGTADKPVGTVCFAWSVPGQPMRTDIRRFDGDRPQVREGAIVHALSVLRDMLQSAFSRSAH